MVDYYINKKRKFVDFLIGNLIWMVIAGSSYFFSLADTDPTYGYLILLLFWFIGLVLAVYFKRKFIFWGIFCLPGIVILLFVLFFGWCLLLPFNV